MANVLRGTVQSGGTERTLPLAGVVVVLFEAGAEAPAILGSTSTDGDGRFAIESPRDTAGGFFYLSATVSPTISLLAVLGPALGDTAVVNSSRRWRPSSAWRSSPTATAFAGRPRRCAWPRG